MHHQEKLTIYTPESALKSPLKLLLSILSNIWSSRELAKRLLYRNVFGKYRESILGLLWIFITPLTSMLVWVILKDANILTIGDTPIPYPIYVIIGVILWNVFQDGVNIPLQVISENKQLLRKINFPHEALLLTALGQTLFNFLVQAILLIPLFWYFNLSFSCFSIIGLLGVILIALFGLSIGIWLAPFGALLGDFQQITQTILRFSFFLTPIIYPLPSEGIASVIANLNPVTPLLVNTRIWLSGAVSSPSISFWIVISITFLLLLIGLIVYRVAIPNVIERIGS